jgi:hypothetical protein
MEWALAVISVAALFILPLVALHIGFQARRRHARTLFTPLQRTIEHIISQDQPR